MEAGGPHTFVVPYTNVYPGLQASKQNHNFMAVTHCAYLMTTSTVQLNCQQYVYNQWLDK